MKVKLTLIIPLILVTNPAFSQEKDIPYVQFREGAIIWYLPSSGEQFRSLPAYIPGFVRIRQTIYFQKLTNAEVTAKLKDELTRLVNTSLSNAQKLEFLEKYACLILLNYLDVSNLPQDFFSEAKDLKSDEYQSIRSASELVVKMFEMYFVGVREYEGMRVWGYLIEKDNE